MAHNLKRIQAAPFCSPPIIPASKIPRQGASRQRCCARSFSAPNVCSRKRILLLRQPSYSAQSSAACKSIPVCLLPYLRVSGTKAVKVSAPRIASPVKIRNVRWNPKFCTSTPDNAGPATPPVASAVANKPIKLLNLPCPASDPRRMPQQQHRKFPPQCHPTPEDRPPPAAGSPEHKIRCAVAKPQLPPPSLLCVPRNHIAVPSAPPRAPSPSARSKLLRSSDHRSRRGASHKAPPLAEWGHSPDETGRSTKTDRGQRDLETNPATAPGGAHLESGPSPRAHLDRFLESITQKLQPAPNLRQPNKTPISTPVQRP